MPASSRSPMNSGMCAFTSCWRATHLKMLVNPTARAARPSVTMPLGQRVLRRSEEHTSELQSRLHLVCRLLLEKKKNIQNISQFKHQATSERTNQHEHVSR